MQYRPADRAPRHVRYYHRERGAELDAVLADLKVDLFAFLLCFLAVYELFRRHVKRLRESVERFDVGLSFAPFT